MNDDIMNNILHAWQEANLERARRVAERAQATARYRENLAEWEQAESEAREQRARELAEREADRATEWERARRVVEENLDAVLVSDPYTSAMVRLDVSEVEK